MPAAYPKLAHLMGGYFHQDYDLTSDDPREILRGYATLHSPGEVERLIGEITDFLATGEAGLLARFEAAFRPDYIIGDNDAEAARWLGMARDTLAEAVTQPR